MAFITNNWEAISGIAIIAVTALAPASSPIAKALPTVLSGLYKTAVLIQQFQLFKKQEKKS